MNAHHRGGQDGFDAADMWVRNPQTGTYELRLDDASDASEASETSGVSGASEAALSTPPVPPAPSRHSTTGPGYRSAPADGHPVPRQRRRARHGHDEPGPAGGDDHGRDRDHDRDGQDGGGPSRNHDAATDTDTDADRRDPDGGRRGSRASRSRSASRAEAGGRGGGGTRGRGRSRSGPGARGGADTDGEATSGRRKRKPKPSRKRKVLMWTGGVLGVALIGTSATAYYVYKQLDGNIEKVDVGDAVTGKQKLAGSPLNILLLGTDKRTGKGNRGYGDKGSAGHADTTFLFHVSADRTNATALSIPRDLITDIPECPTKQKDGTEKLIPGTPNTRFNNSFGQQGRDPGCTARTITEVTGIKPDHFMMVDFNAVKTLTTALGGVDVCLDKPVVDKDAALDLPAGPQKVAGEEALAFVRSRAATKNGSDLDRIEMQQKFMASMIRKAKSDFIGSPTKMYKLANAMTKNLTVDTGIGTVPKLTSLAKELGKIDIKNISFTTIPVIDNPAEPKPITVVVDPNRAPAVLDAIKNDVSLTEVKKKAKTAKDKAKAKEEAVLKGPRAEPSEVSVEVYNGGGLSGAARATVGWLVDTKGVANAVNKNNAPAKAARTTLEYGPDQADQARTVADLMGLPAKALDERPDRGAEQPMTLTLGADFKGAGIPVKPSGEPPKDVKKVQGDAEMCGS
ncbi:LCP family protein [Streptomyces sp. JNUCC 64]